MAFSAFCNQIIDEKIKPEKQDKTEKSDKLIAPKKTENTKNGAVLYATNQKLSLFMNFGGMKHMDNLEIKEIPLEDFNPMCVDFAPFLSRPYQEKLKSKPGKEPEVKEYGP